MVYKTEPTISSSNNKADAPSSLGSWAWPLHLLAQALSLTRTLPLISEQLPRPALVNSRTLPHIPPSDHTTVGIPTIIISYLICRHVAALSSLLSLLRFTHGGLLLSQKHVSNKTFSLNKHLWWLLKKSKLTGLAFEEHPDFPLLAYT